MSSNYKLNIFKDERDIWTEFVVGSFMNIEPIYIKSDDDNFTKKIFTILAEVILDSNNSDISSHEFRYLNGYYTNENESIVEFPNISSSKLSIINLLLDHTDLIIYQISTGKYWSRIYISLEKTNIKGCEYTHSELLGYIKEKFKIY